MSVNPCDTAPGRAAEQLLDGEQRLFRAFKHAPLPVCIVAEDGELLLVSDCCLELTGYAPGELPDALTRWAALAFGDDAGVRAYVRALFASEGPHEDGTFAMRTRSGEERLWEFRSAPIGYTDDGRRLRVSMAHDVTEEQRARQQLVESEQRFRALADSAPVMIWKSGVDKLCTWFNRGWLDFTGRSLADEVGHGWAEGVHADDRDRCVEVYASAFDRRAPFEMEYRLLRHDGAYRWLLARGVPRHDGSGAFTGYIGSCIDITDRREALTEAERSQRWLERVTEASPDVIAVYDVAAARSVYVNKEIESILGYTRAEVDALGGRFLLEIVHPDDLDGVRRFFRALPDGSSGGLPKQIHRIRHADGTYRWMDVRAVPFAHDQDGRVRQSLLIARDVTELEHAAQALRESERRFRRAMVDSPLPMMLHAEDGEILAVSDTLVAATGYARDRIVRIDDWLRLAHGEDAAAVREQIRQDFASEKQPEPCELLVRSRSGAVRQWLFHVSAPQRLSDGRRYFIAVAVDVTELRAAQRALEESGRQKDNFLAMLGHELRNPLATIRHVTELLGMQAPDDHHLARLREVLDRQTLQMARLIDGLLDVSRIVRGKLRLEREPLDLVRVLADVLEDHRADIEAAGLELCSVMMEPRFYVHADATRLAQVFGNLLGNAIKFGGPQGRITVTAYREGDDACVSVRDTGVGIEPAMQAHIFEPFQQAPQSLERSAGGLGLGLSLVKGIIDLHRGRVAVHSDGPGTGATFTVALPLVDAPPASAPARPHEVPEALAILIVEDNEDTAGLLGELLRARGHRAMIAYTGAAGLALARQERPDVILCDLGLPEINGYGVARAIRSDPALAHIWLVALSGYGQQKDREHSHEAGFDAHLTKPVGLAAIDEALASFRTAQSAPR
jgi:PAS domain S-box-containing protein